MRNVKREKRKEKWNYRSLVGMLNFLTNSSHPELAYVVHQCTKFCNNPKRIHEQAIKRIIQYSLSTRTKDGSYKGLLFKIDKTKSINIYVDISFAGDWDKLLSEEPSLAFPITDFVIYYAGCPVVSMSKLQTEISLSTTESEYIALSNSMRDAIPVMTLLDEVKKALPIET